MSYVCKCKFDGRYFNSNNGKCGCDCKNLKKNHVKKKKKRKKKKKEIDLESC